VVFWAPKEKNYSEIIKALLHHYQKSRYWLSLKIHCLHSHIGYFLQNLRAVGEKKSNGLLLVYGKNGAVMSRKVETDLDA
jgi:hypothetical protein